jgi:hypothetical protein
MHPCLELFGNRCRVDWATRRRFTALDEDPMIDWGECRGNDCADADRRADQVQQHAPRVDPVKRLTLFDGRFSFGHLDVIIAVEIRRGRG